MKNLKNNIVAAIVAVATIAGFSAFKLAEDKTQSMVTLYFQGDTQDADQVKDASFWSDEGTPPTCSGNQQACSISVHPDDVIEVGGNNELDPSRITLDANELATDYFGPSKNSSSTSPHNVGVQNNSL